MPLESAKKQENQNSPMLQQSAFCRLIKRQELDAIQVKHPLFTAEILLQGAQLIQFTPQNKSDWIWLSPEAQFLKGEAVRGGIPICWPWFGVPEKNPNAVQASIHSAASHGFAREKEWALAELTESCHGVTLSFRLRDIQSWPFDAEVSATFTLGRSLSIDLTTENRGHQPFSISQALHTYLPTPDIEQTQIFINHHCSYVDALDNWQPKQQTNAISFNQEVDRIYRSGGPFFIRTPTQTLKLLSNSQSAVVWNPWIEKSKRLSQFGINRYQEMFCVETANVLDDYVTIDSGQSHRLTMELTLA